MTDAPVSGVPRTVTYPALPAQLGMLFESLAHPHQGRYVQQLVAELREPLDPEAMEAAWRSAVARHAVLRTGFRLKDLDVPLQEVHEELDVSIAHLDWRHLGGRERERELAALLGDDRALGYEPARPPLSRLALCRFDDADWRLVWSYHHALLDGRSRLAVLQEVFAHYDAHRSGEAVEAPLGPDFGDFARWVADLDVTAALEFWRRELRRFAEPTPVPVRPTTGSEAKPGTLAREIDAAAVDGLRALAEREEVTLGVVLQAAWALLLARETGARDVLFAAVRAGRRSAPFDTEGMVGLLNATVPVRARIDTAADLGGWLRELRARWVEMRPWEHTALVDIQRVSEISPPVPLFRTLFSFERHTTDSALRALGGPFAHRRFELHERLAYPLTASVYEQDETLLVKLLYDGEEVDPSGAERVAVLYTELLKELAAGYAGSLERLVTPSDAAPAELSPAWNDTARAYERDAPIGELLAVAADREPGAVAVIDGERRLSYGELDRAANRLANRLLEMGVEHETRVALAMRRSLGLVVAMAGVVRAGAGYVPLDPDHPRERLEYMVRDSGARALLTDEVEWRPGGALPTIVLDPELRAIAGSSEEAPRVEVRAGSLAYVIYTSGSTGRPKGVAVEHRAVVRLVRRADYLQVDPSDVVAQASNASFDAATFEVWGALLNGAAVAIVPTETTLSPRTLVARIAHDRITVLFLTTQLFSQVAREAPEAFHPLRCLLFGGEAVDPRWVRRALEAGRPGRLLHVYGPTESTTFATWHEVETVEEGRPVPIGLPIANTRAYVLDSGRRAVPVGVTGELYLGGDGLARGYLGQPELTAERFLAGPFGDGEERLYRTGDLVRRRDDGALEFIGRIDDQVKIRGFRVEPAEVETVLSEHPGVVACAVAGREHADAGKRLVAWIVPSTEAPSPHELRSFARRRLPEHMVPAAVVTIDALPLTRHGKVDRAALPEPVAEPGQAEEYSPPRSELEQELVTIWEEALELRPIGVTDNFFDLGGHSLLALRVFAEIDRRLGRTLSPGTIFQAPTIERLAAVVALEGTWEPLVPVQEGGSRRPFFCVHPGAGYAVHFANLARHLGPDRPFYALQVQRLDDSGPVYTPIVEETAARYLQEVRRVQPDGPYLLGGQCFGGIIAFEMAQQLVDAGEEAAMLLVFDSGVPPAVAAKPVRAGPAKEARPGTKAKRVRGVRKRATRARRRAGAAVRRRRRAVRSWWRALGRMERKRHARDSTLLSLAGRARALFGDPQADRERQIIAAHRRAKRLYMPRVYPGRVTLIRSSEFASRSDKETHLLWANLAGGDFESEVVEGRHQTFFKEPHVERLAERVRACIYRAELEADGD